MRARLYIYTYESADKLLMNTMKASGHTAFSLLCRFFFCLLLFLVYSEKLVKANTITVPVNVGVVLDMDTYVGKMGLSCISMALSDFYASHSYYKTRISLHVRDSKGDVVEAAAAALDLLKNVEVQAILGPLSSMQANFLINLGEKVQVPIISFSATSPSLSAIRSPFFVRGTHSDSSQVQAISAIIQAFGWREVVPVYVDNAFGEGIIPFLTDALQEINARVPYRSVVPPLATNDQIAEELYKLMTMQTRIFIVHMLTDLGSRLFTMAKQLGMLSKDYVWIITDALTTELSSINLPVIDSMEGVIGVQPYIPRTKELENFTSRWNLNFRQSYPGIIYPELNAFGLWAYDSTTALIMAVEEAGASISTLNTTTSTTSQRSNFTSANFTELQSIRVSDKGLRILAALLNSKFRGLSGDFRIVNGQLQSTTYEIVNVIGGGARSIGYWTKEYGIVKELDHITEHATLLKNKFRSIIWPGDSTSVPKGWVIPTNGKKLRIGVPVKVGFSEFVKVTRDDSSNTTTITGYCIDVFDAAMAALPYGVPYEYIPFATADGKSAGTHNDLVYQVYLGNFDAVAGDVTIVANRSKYVDFTLPFTESDFTMIVPIKDNKRNNAWVFLKPLTWDLWLTSFLSFIFIGFVIWLLEHRVNQDFRGPPLYQLGMIFGFAFSTMVFAHKERVISNLSRFVLIIWFLVVLILTQSYTASLTSMLTVQQLQPTVTDIKELIKNKEYVGYQEGSFVYEILQQMNFDPSRLIEYKSPEHCDELFSKGSRNGGIAAAFDEVPYMKLFLAKYCNKYTMIGPTYKTDGFGFVFPIGSPLVPDVSRAILNITETEKSGEIEKAWFSQKDSCPAESGTSLSSYSLGLESFWGLFLIVGVVSVLALVTYVATFMREHWHILRRPDVTLRGKIAELAKGFDRKDYSSHTFRKNESRNKGEIAVVPCDSYPQTSTDFSLATSPYTINGSSSPSLSPNYDCTTDL